MVLSSIPNIEFQKYFEDWKQRWHKCLIYPGTKLAVFNASCVTSTHQQLAWFTTELCDEFSSFSAKDLA